MCLQSHCVPWTTSPEAKASEAWIWRPRTDGHMKNACKFTFTHSLRLDGAALGINITTTPDGAVHVVVRRRLMFLAVDKLKICWVAKFQMLKLTYNFIYHVSEWKIVYKAVASRWYDTRSYIWATHANHDCKNMVLRLAVTGLPSSFAFSENYTRQHTIKLTI